jgi:PPOX class probable F420-dependent enzyme
MNQPAISDREKYLSLETNRKNGIAVRTPVWFASAPSPSGAPQLYVYTLANSGKAKRIRRSGAVKIAPCNAHGKVTGQWIEAQAMIVHGDAFAEGMRLLDRKYWPWKRILDLSVLLFPGRRRVVIAIWPT